MTSGVVITKISFIVSGVVSKSGGGDNDDGSANCTLLLVFIVFTGASFLVKRLSESLVSGSKTVL